jgi:glutathione peroxidase
MLNDIQFKTAQGENKTIFSFPAKAYLLVNVASKCGLTPQYEELEALYKKYHAKGLEILAFPANEFLAQEPGTNDEIQEFCRLNYGVSFPVMAKMIVKGEGQHPLYKFLTETMPNCIKNEDNAFEQRLTSKGLITGEVKDIHWNFEKFLVNGKGEIVARFFPDVKPLDRKISSKIEELLK